MSAKKRKSPKLWAQAERDWARWWKAGERMGRRTYPQEPSESRAWWDFAYGFASGYRAALRSKPKPRRKAQVPP